MSEPEFLFVAKTSDIPPNRATCFDIAGNKLVMGQFKGEFYALHNNCTHADQSFDTGRVRAHKLLCPLHGAIFDLRDGSVIGPPATEAIRCFPVKVDGERVLVSFQQDQ